MKKKTGTLPGASNIEWTVACVIMYESSQGEDWCKRAKVNHGVRGGFGNKGIPRRSFANNKERNETSMMAKVWTI
jgi:hypothetical protein